MEYFFPVYISKVVFDCYCPFIDKPFSKTACMGIPSCLQKRSISWVQRPTVAPILKTYSFKKLCGWGSQCFVIWKLCFTRLPKRRVIYLECTYCTFIPLVHLVALMVCLILINEVSSDLTCDDQNSKAFKNPKIGY